MRNLKIEGDNPIVEKKRFDALTTLNKLDDQSLERLAQLSNSPTAKAYIRDQWNMVKGMMGIK